MHSGKRGNEVELEYDDRTLLIATVLDYEDAMLYECHGFKGVHRTRCIELEDFSVVVYIGNIDYDLTKGFNEKELEYFKEWFREEYERKYEPY